MKLYRSIINGIVAGSMVFAMSCTDLDVEVESQLTNDNFPKTKADFEAVTGPVYGQCNRIWGRGTWHLQSQSSDESALFASGGGWYDGGRYKDIHSHTWNADNGWIANVYSKGFSAISTANRVLGMLAETPESPEKERGVAEVRVMRAFFMWQMTDNFGAIPVIEKFGEDKQYDRTSRKEVCEFIEKEITESLPFLSKEVSVATYNRPTFYMAKALLAKMYINWEVYAGSSRYQDVVTVCDDIIRDNKFALDGDYLAMFMPDNGPQIKDFIFSVPWDSEQLRGMTYARFWLHKSLTERFEMPKSPSGPVRALPEAYDRFSLEGDVRNDIWLTGPQFNRDGSPIIINTTNIGLDKLYTGDEPNAPIAWQLTFSKEVPLRGELINSGWKFDVGNDVLGKASGYRCNKFHADKNANGREQNNDVPIFRYADVLLMKAEAILRGATATMEDTPVTLMNQIRNRAKAPEVASVTLDELLDERAREFFDENWRRNDLIRFGKFGDSWTHKDESDANHIIFPIPTQEMILNSHWEQNPGY
ncbi:RagB/SusD family nutrient uptake outer membrane protein [Prolixibacteraceae bacterium JC049]|nr:RagB/SusD family nutrient uptake outer membrane protein [Prolixibacteraceae bacterium JC049]